MGAGPGALFGHLHRSTTPPAPCQSRMAALDQPQQVSSAGPPVLAAQWLQPADHSEYTNRDAALQAAGAHSCAAAPADTAAAAATAGPSTRAAATAVWPSRSDGLAASAGAAVGARWPSHSDCRYTACYCEENVYLLAQALQPSLDPSQQHLFVVFVSNRAKLVPLWRQRAATAADAPVLWVRAVAWNSFIEGHRRRRWWQYPIPHAPAHHPHLLLLACLPACLQHYHVLLILASTQQGDTGQPASLVFDLDRWVGGPVAGRQEGRHHQPTASGLAWHAPHRGLGTCSGHPC
jgi:hypothetical protein